MKKRSTSEVGHAKNVTNFTALIQLLGEMGPLYNPTNPAITIRSLESLRDELTASIQNLANQNPSVPNRSR